MSIFDKIKELRREVVSDIGREIKQYHPEVLAEKGLNKYKEARTNKLAMRAVKQQALTERERVKRIEVYNDITSGKTEKKKAENKELLSKKYSKDVLNRFNNAPIRPKGTLPMGDVYKK